MENSEKKLESITIEAEDMSDAMRHESMESGHHHHHHHSGRTHQSKRKHNSQKKKNGILTWMSKRQHAIINVFTCTVSVICILLMAINFDFRHNVDKELSVGSSEQMIQIVANIYPKDIILVNEAIASFMSEDNEMSVLEIYKAYDGYSTHPNFGLAFSFKYDVVKLPLNVTVVDAVVTISENNNDISYNFVDDNTSIDIYNLKTGTRYKYCLRLELSNGCVSETAGYFTTAKSPRILNIDGIVNARDVGGIKVANGEIKQGLIYRGSELDGAVEKKYCLTEKGINEMISVLKVKYDMDLRMPSDNQSGVDPLGKEVLHKYYGTAMYADVFQPENKTNIGNVFSDLANENNYPIYIHCTYGRDRTGTICYLLGALLGASEQDLTKEYELSAFTDSYVNNEEFEFFKKQLNLFEGDTLQQKTENYLETCGVTQPEMDSIRNIMIAPKH